MKRFAGSFVVALLLVANILVAKEAFAHKWGNWHWNRYGSSVTIRIYNTARYWTEANRAVRDWSSNTILYLPDPGNHTDISLFDGNYGDTGWGGIAEIINYSGDHITHGHARLNYYYGYSSTGKQAVFCQEVGHLFGLTHSNDGGCMGYGYWPGNGYYTVQHNWSDIYDMYRYSHH